MNREFTYPRSANTAAIAALGLLCGLLVLVSPTSTAQIKTPIIGAIWIVLLGVMVLSLRSGREWLRFDEDQLVHGRGRQILHRFPNGAIKVATVVVSGGDNGLAVYRISCGSDTFDVHGGLERIEDFRVLLSETIKDELPALSRVVVEVS